MFPREDPTRGQTIDESNLGWLIRLKRAGGLAVKRRMTVVVARLLRGEPLEVVAREANVSVAKLTEWRERALAGVYRFLKGTPSPAIAPSPRSDKPLSGC